MGEQTGRAEALQQHRLMDEMLYVQAGLTRYVNNGKTPVQRSSAVFSTVATPSATIADGLHALVTDAAIPQLSQVLHGMADYPVLVSMRSPMTTILNGCAVIPDISDCYGILIGSEGADASEGAPLITAIHKTMLEQYGGLDALAETIMKHRGASRMSIVSAGIENNYLMINRLLGQQLFRAYPQKREYWQDLLGMFGIGAELVTCENKVATQAQAMTIAVQAQRHYDIPHHTLVMGTDDIHNPHIITGTVNTSEMFG